MVGSSNGIQHLHHLNLYSSSTSPGPLPQGHFHTSLHHKGCHYVSMPHEGTMQGWQCREGPGEFGEGEMMQFTGAFAQFLLLSTRMCYVLSHIMH